MNVRSALLLPALLVGGCFVDVPLEGRACSEAHRCVSGYVCRAGVCLQPEGGENDAGPPGADAGASDGGVDAGMPTDAGAVDAGAVDAGAVDAGAPDAGAPDAGPSSVIFQDDDAAEFGLGDATLGARWDADAGALLLAPGESSGVFTSRVFEAPFDGEAVAMRWLPVAPYGKPFPDEVASDAEAQGYDEGGADLSGLVFLLHADGEPGTALADGDGLPDATGNAHPTALVDLAPLGDSVFVDGRIGQALSLERDDYLRLTDSDTHEDFAFDAEAFTWSGWVRIPGCGASDDNVILLGGEDPHIWLGATCPAGEANMQVRDDDNAGGGATGTGTSALVGGDWHHLAGVKAASPEQTRVFFDGELVATRDDSWGTFSNFTKELFIGEFPIGTGPDDYNYSSKLTFDELAVFARALSDDEVRGHYRRGALRARLQIRACPTAACSGVPFVGPDGTAQTSFAEPTTSAPAANVDTVQLASPLAGRYFQYRVFLESDAADARPAVRRVRLTIRRP